MKVDRRPLVVVGYLGAGIVLNVACELGGYEPPVWVPLILVASMVVYLVADRPPHG